MSADKKQEPPFHDIDGLLRFVADHHLEAFFFYNSVRENTPFAIQLISFVNGMYGVTVNCDGDRGDLVAKYQITEKEVCDICYEWLSFHLMQREFWGGKDVIPTRW